MIHQLGSVLVVLATTEALACAVFYGLFFRWWTSDEGRHLFTFMGVVAAAMTLWTVLLVAGGTAWTPAPAGPREWARTLTFAAIAWILGDRLRLLAKGKRNERRDGRRR
ncbi:hypothetical protein BJ982_003807 [Sphaerisporangium siamense]|uniref:Uncharacterized protein n=2 Tax=Sphaerisporangium siamense TaxID=795645 RepID=A0A7W7G8Y7_9ACTN|nr:hypothetical protein [Sphaerisporangium siamense]MBB4702263.1 hypothetical protein [Sphaerisporangium siamense]